MDAIERVKFIQCLKVTGMILRVIKYHSDLRYQGDDTMAERMELLIQYGKSVVEEQKISRVSAESG